MRKHVDEQKQPAGSEVTFFFFVVCFETFQSRINPRPPGSQLRPHRVHSSFAGLSSGEKMAAAAPTAVELWDTEMTMTVCRRTRASRQIFNRPPHSLGVAPEVTDAPPGGHGNTVLSSVLPDGLSRPESHRTSQHCGSPSNRSSPRSPVQVKLGLPPWIRSSLSGRMKGQLCWTSRHSCSQGTFL